jgi:hypothetical protein
LSFFPPGNDELGPMEACFCVAPCFVDAMLPAPFGMNFKEIVLFSCSHPNTFMNWLQGGIMPER